MSRRKKIVLVILAAAAVAVAFFAHPCREPDPPDHPVPVDTEQPITPPLGSGT